MDQQAPIAVDLKDVRRDIDSIDDQLLELLQARFDLVEKVRTAKLAQTDSDPMPFRPAREALILRRLSEANNNQIPEGLIVRLWRNIICQSTLSQSRVQINVTSDLFENQPAHNALSEHFIGFDLKQYKKAKMALNSAAKTSFELCAVDGRAKWIDHMANPDFDGMSAILALPYLDRETMQHIIILGRVPSQPTGDDETLVVTKGRLPREFVPAPLWEVHTQDDQSLTSLPGYLDTSDSPLIGLTTNNPNLALKVLGRYPSPFEG